MSNMSIKLDDYDKKILKYLQEDSSKKDRFSAFILFT